MMMKDIPEQLKTDILDTALWLLQECDNDKAKALDIISLQVNSDSQIHNPESVVCFYSNVMDVILKSK